MFKSFLTLLRPFKPSRLPRSGDICKKCVREYSNPSPGEAHRKRIRSTLYYFTAFGVVTVGMSYAAVPLYRMFCQAYSYGGTTAQGHDSSKVESMKPEQSRPIKVRFNADKAANMRWSFKPQQNEITVSTPNYLKKGVKISMLKGVPR